MKHSSARAERWTVAATNVQLEMALRRVNGGFGAEPTEPPSVRPNAAVAPAKVQLEKRGKKLERLESARQRWDSTRLDSYQIRAIRGQEAPGFSTSTEFTNHHPHESPTTNILNPYANR
jgi:hypothetical protein